MKNKKLIFAIFAIVILLSVPFTSKALVAQSGDNVAINEVVDGNFFGAGSVIIIAGTVNGDVFVAGNSITISGTVNGDVFAAGSSIEITGDVNGNLRLAGSSINVRGAVERNILAAGSNLLLSESASVGGHVTCGGASFIANGSINGQLDVAGGSVILNSDVNGDVFLKLEDEGSLTLMPNARLNKNLSYESVTRVDIKEGAEVTGKVTYIPWEKGAHRMGKQNTRGFFNVGFWLSKLINLFSLFVIGLILIYLIPKPLAKMHDKMQTKFWSRVGIGLALVVLIPIVCLILLFTFVGIPLAIIMLVIYGVALYLTKVIVGLEVGKWIAEKLKWHTHAWVSLVIGLVVIMLIRLIPFIGWLFCAIVFFWAVGGWYEVKKEYLKDMR